MAKVEEVPLSPDDIREKRKKRGNPRPRKVRKGITARGSCTEASEGAKDFDLQVVGELATTTIKKERERGNKKSVAKDCH